MNRKLWPKFIQNHRKIDENRFERIFDRQTQIEIKLLVGGPLKLVTFTSYTHDGSPGRLFHEFCNAFENRFLEHQHHNNVTLANGGTFFMAANNGKMWDKRNANGIRYVSIFHSYFALGTMFRLGPRMESVSDRNRQYVCQFSGQPLDWQVLSFA